MFIVRILQEAYKRTVYLRSHEAIDAVANISVFFQSQLRFISSSRILGSSTTLCTKLADVSETGVKHLCRIVVGNQTIRRGSEMLLLSIAARIKPLFLVLCAPLSRLEHPGWVGQAEDSQNIS